MCLKGLQTPMRGWLNQAHVILPEWPVWCRVLKTTQWWGMMLRWWWWERVRKMEKQQWLKKLGGLRRELSKQVAGKWSRKRTGGSWCYKVQGGQRFITMVGHQHCTRSFGSSELIKRDCVSSLFLQHFKRNCSELIPAKISLWHGFQSLDSTPVSHLEPPTEK